MDQGQPQPTSAPISTPASPAPTPPTGESPTPAESTPPPVPGSPAPDVYSELDYEQLQAEFQIQGMNASELRTVFKDAHREVQQWGPPELTEALDAYGAGNDAQLIKGMARINSEYQQLLRDVRRVNAQFRTLGQERGQAAPPIEVPPLAGKALEEAMVKFLDRYFPNTSFRANYTASGFVDEPSVRCYLETRVQEISRLERSLDAGGQRLHQWKSERDTRREQGQVKAMAPQVKALSEAEFQGRYGEIFEQFQEADRAGRWVDKAKWSAELSKLSKARWG